LDRVRVAPGPLRHFRCRPRADARHLLQQPPAGFPAAGDRPFQAAGDRGRRLQGAPAGAVHPGAVPLPGGDRPHLLRSGWHAQPARRRPGCGGAEPPAQLSPAAPGLPAGHLLLQHRGQQHVPHPLAGAQPQSASGSPTAAHHLVHRDEIAVVVGGPEQVRQRVERLRSAIPPGRRVDLAGGAAVQSERGRPAAGGAGQPERPVRRHPQRRVPAAALQRCQHVPQVQVETGTPGAGALGHAPAEKRSPPSVSRTPGHSRAPASSSQPAPTTAPSPITASRSTAPAPITAPVPTTEFSITASGPTWTSSNSTEPVTRAPSATVQPAPTVVPAANWAVSATAAPSRTSAGPGSPGSALEGTAPSTRSAEPRTNAPGVPTSSQ